MNKFKQLFLLSLSCLLFQTKVFAADEYTQYFQCAKAMRLYDTYETSDRFMEHTNYPDSPSSLVIQGSRHGKNGFYFYTNNMSYFYELKPEDAFDTFVAKDGLQYFFSLLSIQVPNRNVPIFLATAYDKNGVALENELAFTLPYINGHFPLVRQKDLVDLADPLNPRNAVLLKMDIPPLDDHLKMEAYLDALFDYDPALTLTENDAKSPTGIQGEAIDADARSLFSKLLQESVSNLELEAKGEKEIQKIFTKSLRSKRWHGATLDLVKDEYEGISKADMKDLKTDAENHIKRFGHTINNIENSCRISDDQALTDATIKATTAAKSVLRGKKVKI